MIKDQAGADRTVLAGLVTLAAAVFAAAVRLRLPALPMGDEPHYLALAQAMVEHHTFDPTPVYEHRDYWSYYPADIDAHVAVVDGRPVPFHNLGAPLLFAVPFLLWGRAGAHLVTLTAALLTVVHVYRLQREHGIRTPYAGLTTGLLVLGSPLYVYASMLFVEPLGMLALVYAARVLLTARPAVWRLALASAGIGYLPWVHGRYAIFPVTFAVLAVLCVPRSRDARGAAPGARGAALGARGAALGARGALIAALVPVAVLATGLEAFNAVMYHSLSPAPGSTDALGEGLLRQSPLRGLLYLTFDGRFGLLPNFPVLLLSGAGILLCATRAHRRLNLVLLGTAVPYAVLIATYPNWPGGFSPPGRLLSVTVPLLAYYAAALLQRLPSWPLLAAAQLAALYGYTMSLLSDAYPLERFHWLADPRNTPLDRMATLLGTSVDRLPPLVTADNQIDGAAAVRFAAWGTATAAAVVLLWLRARRSPSAPAGAGLGAREPASFRGLGPASSGGRERTSGTGAGDSPAAVSHDDRRPEAASAGRSAGQEAG
ncbi:hypothetical protein Daura_39670 [Dactylosporangium aurantiacum]|uniref:Uncharacterized protein n=1 Tax=Dactylosporangium aurantiacum TaxID=35754 RepID=A0A9Q9MKB8_9ACTN|nr:hypothetical protein [Dactylosporangium aurantiacum]MDG6101457.1 hypothetical protein [Dactylosporangium aurantiacum]UWZ52692.1 hypothetical protein Daura_39670 [Dactylosporangium aurantiacum]